MLRRIRFSTLPLALAAGLAFVATDAAAQVCVGVPGSNGQNVIRGSIGFPDNANTFGVEYFHHLSNSPLSIRARYAHVSVDVGDNNANLFGGGLSYDLQGRIGGFSPDLGFCVLGDLTYFSFDGGSGLEIPIGVGFGGSFAVGQGGDIALMPFAAPAIYHSRFNPDVGDSQSSTDLDVVLGATAVFTGFHVGLDIQNLFRDAASSLWGGSAFITLRGGFTF